MTIKARESVRTFQVWRHNVNDILDDPQWIHQMTVYSSISLACLENYAYAMKNLVVCNEIFSRYQCFCSSYLLLSLVQGHKTSEGDVISCRLSEISSFSWKHLFFLHSMSSAWIHNFSTIGGSWSACGRVMSHVSSQLTGFFCLENEFFSSVDRAGLLCTDDRVSNDFAVYIE